MRALTVRFGRFAGLTAIPEIGIASRIASHDHPTSSRFIETRSFASRMEKLGALTLRDAVPTVYQYRDFATAGGLISYGGSITEMYRNAGVYLP